EDDHVALRAAQDLGQLLVAGRDPRPGVHHEENEVCLLDRRRCLLDDPARDRIAVGHVDAARVDDREALAVPLADELLAVTGHAGRRVDDGGARLGEPVDQRRLADVRVADDRDLAEKPVLFGHGYAAWRARTISSIRFTTSSTCMSVVSISTESSAATIRSASCLSRLNR